MKQVFLPSQMLSFVLGASSLFVVLNGWAAPTPPKPASPIINGEAATEEEFPMTGGVIEQLNISGAITPIQRLMCTSTLIAPDTVLLAAHCLSEQKLSAAFSTPTTISKVYWSWKADLTNYTQWVNGTTPPKDAAAGNYWKIHPKHDSTPFDGDPLYKNYDIALLFLKEPISTIPFAYLPTKSEANQYLLEQAPLWVVG
jgi:hypothetical protein